MCIMTSAKGLRHNLETWNFYFCGEFKLMEQDAHTALSVFKNEGLDDLYKRLQDWDFNSGSFKIAEKDYDRVMNAIKKTIEKESKINIAS